MESYIHTNSNWTLLTLLFFFGLPIAVFGSGCKSIEPQDDFDIKKIAGDWSVMALDVPNPTDADRLDGLKCPMIRIGLENGENKPNIWSIAYSLGDRLVNISATYTVPDHRKGFLKITYKEPKLFFDYTIRCTDLKTYAIGYVCTQLTPEAKTEFYAIALKDPKKYEELIAKPEVVTCLGDVSSKPVGEWLFHKFNSDDCLNGN